ncbi:MAG: hypothetical protein LBE12_15905 [Planctomycetaceae bacterium]|jgi:hypothetical protein|nr:hypothetical protein [Planctomycetaceae bacterium]
MRVLFFCVYVAVYIFFIFCPVTFCAEKTGEDIAKKMWNDLKSIKSTKTVPQKFTIEFDSYPVEHIYACNDEAMVFYWKHISDKCQDIFIAALANAHKNNQVESFTKTYAGFLGSDGCAADMRWVLACPTLTTPNDLFVNFHEVQDPPSEVVLKEEVKFFSIVFVRAIVENSLKSKDYCKRMCQLSVWWGFSNIDLTRNLAFNDNYKAIEANKLTKNDFAYWHIIRQLILIAYICDCETILTNIQDLTDNKSIIKAFDLILKQVKLLGGIVSFDQKESRYVVSSFVMPPITRPKVPFHDAYFSNEQKPNAIPRIYFLLVRSLFSDDFTKKIIAADVKQ